MRYSLKSILTAKLLLTKVVSLDCRVLSLEGYFRAFIEKLLSNTYLLLIELICAWVHG